MSHSIRITIDGQDATDEPEAPFTLTVTAVDRDGIPSREPADWGGESAIVGANIPAMLRELADQFEAGLVQHYGEPLTVDLD